MIVKKLVKTPQKYIVPKTENFSSLTNTLSQIFQKNKKTNKNKKQKIGQDIYYDQSI